MGKRELYIFYLKEEMKKNNDFCDLDRHFCIGK